MSVEAAHELARKLRASPEAIEQVLTLGRRVAARGWIPARDIDEFSRRFAREGAQVTTLRALLSDLTSYTPADRDPELRQALRALREAMT